MKREFKFTLKVKNCDKKFNKDMDEGALVEQTIAFDFSNVSHIRQQVTLLNHSNALIKELIEEYIEVIITEEKT